MVTLDNSVAIQYDNKMDDFIPDPVKSYKPKKLVVAKNTLKTTKGFIPDMDDAQLRKLAREKLSGALQAIDPLLQPELTRKLCAELMDRLDGKPAQAVTLDATVRNITVNANIRFIGMQPNADNIIIDHVDNTKAIDNNG